MPVLVSVTLVAVNVGAGGGEPVEAQPLPLLKPAIAASAGAAASTPNAAASAHRPRTKFKGFVCCTAFVLIRDLHTGFSEVANRSHSEKEACLHSSAPGVFLRILLR